MTTTIDLSEISIEDVDTDQGVKKTISGVTITVKPGQNNDNLYQALKDSVTDKLSASPAVVDTSCCIAGGWLKKLFSNLTNKKPPTTEPGGTQDKP